jgi:hypothetical protein
MYRTVQSTIQYTLLGDFLCNVHPYYVLPMLMYKNVMRSNCLKSHAVRTSIRHSCFKKLTLDNEEQKLIIDFSRCTIFIF